MWVKAGVVILKGFHLYCWSFCCCCSVLWKLFFIYLFFTNVRTSIHPSIVVLWVNMRTDRRKKYHRIMFLCMRNFSFRMNVDRFEKCTFSDKYKTNSRENEQWVESVSECLEAEKKIIKQENNERFRQEKNEIWWKLSRVKKYIKFIVLQELFVLSAWKLDVGEAKKQRESEQEEQKEGKLFTAMKLRKT